MLGILAFTNAIAMLHARRAHPDLRPLRWWTAASAGMAVGGFVVAVFALRIGPMAIPAGVAIIFAALWAMFIGCVLSVDRRPPWRASVAVAVAGIVAFTWMHAIDALAARAIVRSGVDAVVFWSSAWVLLSAPPSPLRRTRKATAVLMVVHGGVEFWRGIAGGGTNTFGPNPAIAAFLIETIVSWV